MECLPLYCCREPGSGVPGRGSALRWPSERRGGAGAPRSAGAGWCLGVGMLTGCWGSDRVGPQVGRSSKAWWQDGTCLPKPPKRGAWGGGETLVMGDSGIRKETFNLSHGTGGLPPEGRRQLG